MTEQTCTVKEGVKDWNPIYFTPETWAFLILRLFLGLRLLTAGIGKFIGPDGFSLANVHDKFFSGLYSMFLNHTFLPGFLLKPYLHLLPYCEILFSVMLLLGIRTKCSLGLMGLLYVSLAFGQMLLPGGASTVADIGVHLILVIVALMLVKHNKFQVCGCS